MATTMARRGEPKGMLGWPQKPCSSLNQSLRLCVKCDAQGNSQLDLSHRGLTHIPHQVFQFQQLDVLKLSHNHLDQLPAIISYLRGIRTLHLQHNLLSSLPPTLVNCRHLSELDLTQNQLTSLPKGLGALKNLRVLKVGKNQLEQIPHEVGALSNLRVLDLHGNRLWYFPFSIQNLYHLLRLDLSDNLFDQIPLVVTKLTWLRALDLSQNRLAALPPDFDQMRELRELNLSENRFVALGVMATKLRQIKYLSLSHNRLTFLPQQITNLKNMRVLHLKSNCLESLPDDFQHLKYLNVADNKLKHFSVLRMGELVALDASGNELVALPRGVYGLKHLQRLNLARNAITEVPEDIGWLKNLQSLDLSENDLRSLPASLHFMEKLTSFNVRGNHKISRPAQPPQGKENDVQEAERNGSRPSMHRAERKKSGRSKLLRKYSSMPSLQPQPSLSRKAPSSAELPSRSKASADWPQAGDAATAQQDRTWLDNFLLSKPQRSHRRASWDANMTLRTARSIPYPVDDRYDTGEIRASFSAESLDSNSKEYRFHDPLSAMSFHSDDNDDDSALEASFSSNDSHHHRNGGSTMDGNTWLLDYTHPKSPHKKKPKKSMHTSISSKSAAANLTLSPDETQKKIPFSTTDSTTTPASNRDQTEMKLAYNSAPNLGIYNYRNSEMGSSEPRQMNVLMTNASKPNSQHGTVQKKNKPAPSSQNRGTQILRSGSKWTMRSRLSEPLTIQTWTQTAPEQVNVDTGTQTRSLDAPMVPADMQHNPGRSYTFAGLRSPDSPPMLPVPGSGKHGNSEVQQRPLGPGNSSPSQPSPASSSTLHPPTSDTRANFSSGTNPASRRSLDPGYPGDGGQVKTTDYTLLGVCNQIQTLLHKDLLQPVIGFNGQHTGRFSNKTISRGDNGAWHFGQAGAVSSSQGLGLEAGLEYSPGETFTTTERGGHYLSAFCPHLQVSVPPGATHKTLHVTLQQLTVSPAVLRAIGNSDQYVANILSIGPIVFLNALEQVTFTSPVTLTLPAPAKVKGHQGHLVVVSIRHDNMCVPCTTGYQSSRTEVTLTTWHMTGKVAVLTKAKCKYKACKSVEHLLVTLNIITSSAPHTSN